MNIDKDIEKVNKLWYLLDDVYSTGLVENKERDEYQQAISNVLSELKETKGTLKCTQDGWYSTSKELETWKKIAENLANTLSKEIFNKLGIKPRIEDLIEVTRKEVEKDE